MTDVLVTSAHDDSRGAGGPRDACVGNATVDYSAAGERHEKRTMRAHDAARRDATAHRASAVHRAPAQNAVEWQSPGMGVRVAVIIFRNRKNSFY
jgi:hypothetical protein